MTKKPLFMEHTEVPAEKTASEISAVLIQAGATQIATDFENGKITGLRWIMRGLMFAMPARVDPVYQIFLKRTQYYQRYGQVPTDTDGAIRAKAVRVAWRQLFRWVQAQVAMIECGMAEETEVFFPYAQTAAGQSVYELFKGSEFKQLGPGPVQ